MHVVQLEIVLTYVKVMSAESKFLSHQQLLELYRNISRSLNQLSKNHRPKDIFLSSQNSTSSSQEHYNDSANAWMYILFVLMFYAFSIVILMIKYIRREREGSKLEYYYNEFVKRDWYKDKNLYDSRGRRIHFKVSHIRRCYFIQITYNSCLT